MPTQRKSAKSAKKSAKKSASKTASKSPRSSSRSSQGRSGGRSTAGKTSSRSSSGSQTRGSARKSSSRGAGKRATSSRSAGKRASPSRRSKAPNALELLTEDHRNVQKMFRRAERMKGNDPQLQDIVQRACAALTEHAQIEEELFYPRLRQQDEDLIEEAEVEHDVAKQLIAQLEGMGPRDDRYKATFKVLGEYVNHHIEEEESQVFRAARRAKLDLASIAEEIIAAKQGSMEAQGGEGAGGTERGAAGGKRATKRRSSARTSGRSTRESAADSEAGESSEEGEPADVGSDVISSRAGYGATDGDAGEDTEQPGRSGRMARSSEEEGDEGAEIDVETPGGASSRASRRMTH